MVAGAALRQHGVVVGSLQSLWLMLAYAPVAPAPAPPPAVPPAAEVSPGALAPAPAPAPSAAPPAAEPKAQPAPDAAVAPETAAPPEAAEPASETATDAIEAAPLEPATTDPVDSPEVADPDPDSDSAPTPHTVTLVHRGSVSSSTYNRYEQPEPRDSHEEFFVSGYGGIITRGSAVSRKMGILRGFHGGLLLGDRLSIGLAYHRLKRRFGAPILDARDQPLAIEMAYGGMELGATVVRRGRFELGVQTLFGGGAACLTYDVNGRSNVAECVESVRMMVLEPSAIANIRITDWMRMGIEGGYRGVARSQWRPPNDFDLGGGFFGLNLDFGWFARPERD